MKLNIAVKRPAPRTHEGAIAIRLDPLRQLERTLMTCMLWENTFYESGMTVAERIGMLVPACKAEDVAALAIRARNEMKLRHAPLLVVREMARASTAHKLLVASTLKAVVQRPDELTEFLAIYWKDKRQPLSAQVKKGLARAFLKFNEYGLAKYNRDGAVKLRDVMFLTHPKPVDGEDRYTKDERRRERETGTKFLLTDKERMFQRLVDGALATPDTWEVKLSAGEDKRTTFLRLMAEKKLGALAFLRNLRNMTEAGISTSELKQYAETMNVDRVLPFRFLSAARAVPALEPMLEPLMLRCMRDMPKWGGKTAIVIDNSGSMQSPVSGKSDISRRDAAAAVAILLRELCDEVDVIAFGDRPVLVPPRRGFALRDAIAQANTGYSTMIGKAATFAAQRRYDRIIIITDEQSQDRLDSPLKDSKAYLINVAAYENGVGYNEWLHIDGWSEAVIDFIREYEAAYLQ